jgi:hypothetical protein
MHFEIAVDADTLARIAASLPASGGGGNPPAEQDWLESVAYDELVEVTRQVIYG